MQYIKGIIMHYYEIYESLDSQTVRANLGRVVTLIVFINKMKKKKKKGWVEQREMFITSDCLNIHFTIKWYIFLCSFQDT